MKFKPAELARLGQAGLWQEALAGYSTSRPDAFRLSATLGALGKCTQWHAALALFFEARSRRIHADLVCYNAVVGACEKAREWKMAQQLLQQTLNTHRNGGGNQSDGHSLPRSSHLATYSYNTILKNSCGTNWRRAMTLFDEMIRRSVRADVVTYNILLGTFEQGSHWQRAVATLKCMRQSEVDPDVVTHSIAISACERSTRWTQALHMLKGMWSKDITPNVVSYSAAISACNKGNRWDSALCLLASMQEHRVEANLVSFNSLVSACASGTEWEQALHLFWLGAAGRPPFESLAPQLNASSLSAATSGCQQGAQWTLALGLLDASRTASITPNWVVLDTVVNACLWPGKWAAALSLIDCLRVPTLPHTVQIETRVAATHRLVECSDARNAVQSQLQLALQSRDELLHQGGSAKSDTSDKEAMVSLAVEALTGYGVVTSNDACLRLFERHTLQSVNRELVAQRNVRPKRFRQWSPRAMTASIHLAIPEVNLRGALARHMLSSLGACDGHSRSGAAHG